MKHTPGPWEVKEFPPEDNDGEEALTAIVAYGEDGAIIADVNRWTYGGEPPTEESRANARLIAAAPELAEALKAVADYAAYWSEYDVPLGLHEKIKAALRKAGVE